MNFLLKPIHVAYLGMRRLCVMDVTRLLHLPADQCSRTTCPEGYEVRAVHSRELSELIESGRVPENIGNPNQLEDGCRAVIAAFHDGQAVSFMWFAKHSIKASDNMSRAAHLGTSIDLPDGTAFVYNAWTDRGHRGQRLVGSILTYAVRHRILGAWALLTSVDWTNHASIQAFKFIGMQSLGTVVRLGHGRLQVSVIPSEARRLGLKVAEDAPGYKIAL
jgi:hypothetical protein